MSFGGLWGGVLGAFWEPGEVIFLCFFGCVFWTTPGATPDRQRGVPGVVATDWRSKEYDNFDGLGPGGGATMIYRTSNKDNQQSLDYGKSDLSALEVEITLCDP